MVHPIYVLGLVLFIGIVVWPYAKAQEIVPRAMEADLVAVVALILGYMAYKSWWQKQQGK